MVSVFEIQQAKGLPHVAAWIEAKVMALPGVLEAKCSSLTGRLRIKWKKEVEEDLSKSLDVGSLIEKFSLREAYRLQAQGAERSKMFHAPEKGWHALHLKRLKKKLRSDFLSGLDNLEISKRLEKFGFNSIPTVNARTKIEILIEQFKNPGTLLLLASVTASIFTGGYIEAIVILGVIAVNGTIGFLTESQSERALKKLSEIGPEEALVVREGRTQVVPSIDIVAGDVLYLKPGASVVADARVIEAHNLSLDESILTGESLPVLKEASLAIPLETPLPDRKNMVFTGSVVVSGSGRAMVVETGENTQAGQIQGMLGDRFHRTTSLQKKLNVINRELIDLGMISAVALLGIGFFRGQPWLQVLKTGISLAVAAVPEGLPTVSTWTLSSAVSNLLRKNVLIRDLQAVETIGALQVLCLDKTGTLTENRMHVEQIAVPAEKDPQTTETVLQQKDPHFRAIMECATLCNDAELSKGKPNGSATEQAMLDVAQRFGINLRIRKRYERVKTKYRSDTRRHMITTHRDKKGTLIQMMKGDPEEVLALCRQAKVNGHTAPLSGGLQKRCLAQNEKMSKATLRVLGFAYREGDGDWIWLGLMGMKDPARPELKKSLARFHNAGIRTVMITGDQAPTAAALAKELKLSNGEKLVIVDLKDRKLSPEELTELAHKAHVFARVAPEDKRNIVEAIRKGGNIVGMVGDGINDAPALKAAHVGIAIGRGGAEVAREVASVVLLEDRIEHLLDAVELGRSARESLRKSVHYLVSTNVSEMAVVLGESAAGLREIMDPLQLLWINLVNDTLPALALAMDKPKPNILKEKPQNPKAPLLSKKDYEGIAKESAIFFSLVMSSLLYGHSRKFTMKQNQTMAVNTLTISQALHALSSYSDTRIQWKEIWKEHKPLLFTSLGGVATHVALTAVPGLRRLFKVSALKPVDFAVSAAIPLIGLLAIEWQKQSASPQARTA